MEVDLATIAAMATTRIRQSARRHLYIDEWLEHRGLSDETMGGRLGVARETVWRWRTQQHRLNPEKIAALASALDIDPIQLWSPPTRTSVDAMLTDASDDLRQKAAEMVSILVRTGTG